MRELSKVTLLGDKALLTPVAVVLDLFLYKKIHFHFLTEYFESLF